MERVVVTGLGVASPLGCTVDAFWEGLIAGRPGVVALDPQRYGRHRSRIGALLSGYDEAPYVQPKEARRMNRASRMALVAAAQAVEQAGLLEPGVDRQAVAVVIASSIAGFAAADPFFEGYYQRGASSPLVIPLAMNSGPASNVSIRYGFQGPLMSVDAACASAAHALGYCFHLIRSGAIEVAVTGGSDSPFAPGVVEAWCALRALSQRNAEPATACRPFSADRDGMVLGEGAGVLVLESETSARRRGRAILAELQGYGASSDSFHLTQPAPDGPASAMRRALLSAQLAPEDIDWIDAHGTGTDWNDRTETAAIKAVYGPAAYRAPVVSHKAAIGHAIAASMALQVIGAVCSLGAQVVPPTINYTQPDPECDLDYVTAGARPQPIARIMCNAFAFGGSNAALILGQYEPG
jgi:3-oxoacyl-(acyl-carrier-protein) synthase